MAYESTEYIDEPERIIVRFRRHGAVLTGPLLVLLICAVLAGAFIGKFAAAWANLLVASGIALLLIVGFVVPFFKWFAGRTTITTRRVIVRGGVFTRTREEISIVQVRTVASRRSPLQRLVGAGDIDLTVTDSDAMRLINVPGIAAISEVLQEQIEKHYNAQARTQTGYYAGGVPQPNVPQADAGSSFVARRRS
ncbi:PH domain-containing protein [Canibacter zhoujuaniae]|uniref:PH domain-containing protein n=1 Tax=Canibacter zhoujuaniae TaxID=2708343 RepID=UPI0014216664|nr:PH domain-containing protein [Canibacter zhoujuaniae]